jgi:hypothetical protein
VALRCELLYCPSRSAPDEESRDSLESNQSLKDSTLLSESNRWMDCIMRNYRRYETVYLHTAVVLRECGIASNLI